jgi:hypothetical protein
VFYTHNTESAFHSPQGATRAQARAALKQHRDVMEAAEKIFEGAYDNIADEDGDLPMSSAAGSSRNTRLVVRLFFP